MVAGLPFGPFLGLERVLKLLDIMDLTWPFGPYSLGRFLGLLVGRIVVISLGQFLGLAGHLFKKFSLGLI